MKLPKVNPPKTKKELFERIEEIVQVGEYEMPDEYAGTGAPGVFLEDLLGLTTGNKDIPDSLGWEIKFFNPKTNLITLFHLEPSPEKAVRYMVSKYGTKNDRGELSFRHTIKGKSDRFDIQTTDDRIVVRVIGGNGVVPYWTHDQIMSAAGAKLRRLILIRGVRSGQTIVYNRADCFEDLSLTGFIESIVKGTVAVDFDAREMTTGSKGLRNHGTKFRVSPDDMCRLYTKKLRLS
jgi:hypothetical protein